MTRLSAHVLMLEVSTFIWVPSALCRSLWDRKRNSSELATCLYFNSNCKLCLCL